MLYLLDEDLTPAIAEIGRGRGLEVISVHEIGRRGFSDAEQLAFAAQESRVFVTRNRDDFIRLTVTAFQTLASHAGVLVVPRSLPNHQPERIAGALYEWDRAWPESEVSAAYLIDFLPS